MRDCLYLDDISKSGAEFNRVVAFEYNGLYAVNCIAVSVNIVDSQLVSLVDKLAVVGKVAIGHLCRYCNGIAGAFGIVIPALELLAFGCCGIGLLGNRGVPILGCVNLLGAVDYELEGPVIECIDIALLYRFIGHIERCGRFGNSVAGVFGSGIGSYMSAKSNVFYGCCRNVIAVSILDSVAVAVNILVGYGIGIGSVIVCYGDVVLGHLAFGELLAVSGALIAVAGDCRSGGSIYRIIPFNLSGIGIDGLIGSKSFRTILVFISYIICISVVSIGLLDIGCGHGEICGLAVIGDGVIIDSGSIGNYNS